MDNPILIKKWNRFFIRIVRLFIATGCLAHSSATMAFDCLIEPLQMIELGSPASGLLDKVYVGRAERVEKGQIVATLESRAELSATQVALFKSQQTGEMAMAKNKIDFAKRKFTRLNSLSEKSFMAKQDIDDVESVLRLAESELKVAVENHQLAKLEYQQQGNLLDLRTIRSPFDGVVVEQLAYPGEVIESGSSRKSVLKVAQLNPLQVHIVLPKHFFGKVTPGIGVKITPELQLADDETPAESGLPKILGDMPSTTKAIPQKTNGHYVAKVKTVDRIIDAASGTFVVLVELPNPQLAIPAGIRCQAIIEGVNEMAKKR